jgi:flagellar motor switch protein FliN/FliY
MNKPNPPSDDIKKKPGVKKTASEDSSAKTLDEQKIMAEKSNATTEGVFQTLAPEKGPDSLQDINLIADIPVKLCVEFGRTKMTIKDLLRLSQGSAVTLDGLAGEPLDILVNDYLIAQGEVVVVGEKYAIRITEIITPSERIRRLSR